MSRRSVQTAPEGRNIIAHGVSLWAIAVVLLASVAAPLRAMAGGPIQPATIGKPRIGFAQRYKLGYWTPVRISVSAGSQAIRGHLEVIVPDGDGVPCRFRSGVRSLAAHESSDFELLVKFGRADRGMETVLRSDDDSSALAAETFDGDSVPLALASTRELIVCLGAVLPLEGGNHQAEKAVVVEIDDAADLPCDELGYDGIDWLVIATSHAESKLSPNPQTVAAIDRWLKQGGDVLLLSGRETEQMARTPLGRLLPGKFERLVRLRRSAAIEGYSETSERLGAGQGSGAVELQVPQLAEVEGQIEAFEGNDPRDLPLVIRAPRGFGQLVWAGLDLDRPPFSDWPGRRPMLDRLLGRNPRGDNEPDESFGQSGGAIGYLDLSGQMRTSLEQFARVRFVPFWFVAALAAIYVLLIGPADYFLLKKLNRPQLTWITFPLLAALFFGGAYCFAYRAKGTQVQVNQVDLVDVDLPSRQVRGTTWINFFSPRNETTSLALQTTGAALPFDTSASGDRGASQAPVAQLSWLGLPGTGIGAMDSSAMAPNLFTEPYDVAREAAELRNVPIAIWSTKGFQAGFQAEISLADHGIELNEDPSRQLRGTIANPLDVELRDCVLYYNRWAYSLGTLRANFRGELAERTTPQGIDGFLTERRVGHDQDETQPYDRLSAQPSRVLQLLMFYEAAGGRGYTRLADRYLRRLDLSRHLRLGRAMLVGRGPHATRLSLDGQPLPAADRDQELTVYRFVINVKREE